MVSVLRAVVALVVCGGLALGIGSAPASASVASATTAARDLVAAMEERLALAVPVAAAKRASGTPVDDPVREAQGADAFVALVAPFGIPDAQARTFIHAQFEASKVVQRALLQQWAARPDTVPAGDPPNLVTQVRPAIDAATTRLAAAYVRAGQAAAADPAAWRSAMTTLMRSPRGQWRWQRDSLSTALRPALVLGRP